MRAGKFNRDDILLKKLLSDRPPSFEPHSDPGESVGISEISYANPLPMLEAGFPYAFRPGLVACARAASVSSMMVTADSA